MLADGLTREVTSAAILFEDAGEHIAEGKTEPLRLWRAVRVVAGTRGREREGSIEAPFIGRDTELRLVKDLLHATAERRATRLVAISGEAGVEKSRLRREFSNYTDGLADTFLWHLGRCLSYGDRIAFWALSEMVRQRFAIPEDAPSHEWKDSDDTELRCTYDGCVVIVCFAEGSPEEVVARGLPALRIAIDARGATAEATRDCWPPPSSPRSPSLATTTPTRS